MKKFLLATTLLVVCSLNFVETLSATNVNHPQNGNSVTQWNAIAIQVLASDPGLVLERLEHGPGDVERVVRQQRDRRGRQAHRARG